MAKPSLGVALSEQMQAVNLGDSAPRTIQFSAEDVDCDYTTKWDTDEKPSKPERKPPQSSKPQPACMTGEMKHRWFKQPDNSFTCDICKINRSVTGLTKVGWRMGAAKNLVLGVVTAASMTLAVAANCDESPKVDCGYAGWQTAEVCEKWHEGNEKYFWEDTPHLQTRYPDLQK